MTQNHDLQNTLRAIADPTRRDILLMLREQDMTIAEIATNFPITRAAVKKHLTILNQGRLISTHPKGREVFNHLEPHAFKSVADWLNFFNSFWDTRLASLKDAVETETKPN